MYSPFALFYFLMVLYIISYFGENHQFLFSKGPGGSPGGSPGGGPLGGGPLGGGPGRRPEGPSPFWDFFWVPEGHPINKSLMNYTRKVLGLFPMSSFNS